MVQRVAQAGVDDLQHHTDHLLNHTQVLRLTQQTQETETVVKCVWTTAQYLGLCIIPSLCEEREVSGKEKWLGIEKELTGDQM